MKKIKTSLYILLLTSALNGSSDTNNTESFERIDIKIENNIISEIEKNNSFEESLKNITTSDEFNIEYLTKAFNNIMKNDDTNSTKKNDTYSFIKEELNKTIKEIKTQVKNFIENNSK